MTAVQNPMTSLADDIATTKRVLDAEAQKGPVIVVGHSYGGAVITGAAAGNPNVKALVYIAAFAPEAGEPVAAFLEQYPSLLGSGTGRRYGRVSASSIGTSSARSLRRMWSARTARVMAAAQKPIFGEIFGQATRGGGVEEHPLLVSADDTRQCHQSRS